MSEWDGTRILAEPGKQQIEITRVFDAPRELVFQVLTDPEHIPDWWGPSYLTTTVDTMEPRWGGRWRFVQRASDGTEHPFHGVYHAVVPPRQVVSTFEYEGWPGPVSLETTTLEDLAGRTKLTVISVFQTLTDRDGMVSAGMETGARETWRRFAELVAKIGQS